MSRSTTWTINPAGGGRVRILASADQRTGDAVGIGIDFTQDEVRRMVEDLCRCAGLPDPWEKG